MFLHNCRHRNAYGGFIDKAAMLAHEIECEGMSAAGARKFMERFEKLGGVAELAYGAGAQQVAIAGSGAGQVPPEPFNPMNHPFRKATAKIMGETGKDGFTAFTEAARQAAASDLESFSDYCKQCAENDIPLGDALELLKKAVWPSPPTAEALRGQAKGVRDANPNSFSSDTQALDAFFHSKAGDAAYREYCAARRRQQLHEHRHRSHRHQQT